MTNISAIKNLTIKQWKIFLMTFRTLLMNEYFIFLFTHTLKAEKRRKQPMH